MSSHTNNCSSNLLGSGCGIPQLTFHNKHHLNPLNITIMILFWILGGGFLGLLLAKFIIGVISIIFEILDGILSMIFDHD